MPTPKESLLSQIRELSTSLPDEVSELSRLETDLGINGKRADQLVNILQNEYNVTLTETGLHRLYHQSAKKHFLYGVLTVILLVFTLVLLFLLLGNFVNPVYLILTALIITYFIHKAVHKKFGYKNNELRVEEIIIAQEQGILS